MARSIFSGLPLCDKCTPPKPVNLPDISQILRLIALLVDDRGKLFGFSADIRLVI